MTPSPRPFLFCLVPADRADTLLAPLREHFASQPQVAVLVEQRAPEGDQRRADPEVRGYARAPVAERDPRRALPPTLRPAARGLRFVQRMEPVGRTHEATDTSDLLALSRAEDTGAVSELWWRFSGRVLARLRSRLGDLAAEAATAEVLGLILDALGQYDPVQQPPVAWLDEIVDRYVDERAQIRASASLPWSACSGTTTERPRATMYGTVEPGRALVRSDEWAHG